MLRFIKGDLFKSEAQTLVNTVNCVGFMGKGVALEFKTRYPNMFKDYKDRCSRGQVRPGILMIYKETTPWVLNFPTKRHWKGKSIIDDIEAGLSALVNNYKEWGIKSLAMPALGCGYGGLDWAHVKPLIERYLSDVSMDVEVYEPATEEELEEIRRSNTPIVYQGNMFGDKVDATPKKKRVKKK
jgi:O-acetyl-ADP-ribose deacetylase (regulator of RNase III)